MKKIVFTFGRFNPPTTGHLLLATKVKEEARRRGADYKIYGSNTKDAKRNPLSAVDKSRFMKKVLKDTNIVVNKDSGNPYTVLQQLSKEGYTDVTMVVGADRVPEFKNGMKKYIGKKGYENIANFDVVSAGERDPDAEGVEGMSASKMRAAAAEGNLNAFKLGIPSHVSEADRLKLFKAVRKGMGVRGKIQETWFDYDEFVEFTEEHSNQLNEKLDFKLFMNDLKKKLKMREFDKKERARIRGLKKDIRWYNTQILGLSESGEEELNEISVQARRKMARSAKRTAKIRARKRKLKEKRRKGKKDLVKKANKAAINKVRAKLIRGMKWSDVPFLQREKIDAKIKKKKKRIAAIAKKMMPAMQKAEKERLAKVRARMTATEPSKAVESIDLDFENTFFMEDRELRARIKANDEANRRKKEPVFYLVKTKGGKKHAVVDRVAKNHTIEKEGTAKQIKGVAQKYANEPDNFDWTDSATAIGLKQKEQKAVDDTRTVQGGEHKRGEKGEGKPVSELSPEEKKLQKKEIELASKDVDAKIAEYDNAENEEIKAELTAKMQKQVDKLNKKKPKGRAKNPTDVEKAEYYEAASVDHFNIYYGNDIEEGGVSKADRAAASRSIVLTQQQSERYGLEESVVQRIVEGKGGLVDYVNANGGDEDFQWKAVHAGKNIKGEENVGVHEDWAKGSGPTSKSDLVLVQIDSKTGKEVKRHGFSMKIGSSRLITSAPGETMALMKMAQKRLEQRCSGPNAPKNCVSKLGTNKETRESIEEIISELEDKEKTYLRTGIGVGPSGWWTPSGGRYHGDEKSILSWWYATGPGQGGYCWQCSDKECTKDMNCGESGMGLKGTNVEEKHWEGTDVAQINPEILARIKSIKEWHGKLAGKLNKILGDNPDLADILFHEAATGCCKFCGCCSDGCVCDCGTSKVATQMITASADGSNVAVSSIEKGTAEGNATIKKIREKSRVGFSFKTGGRSKTIDGWVKEMQASGTDITAEELMKRTGAKSPNEKVKLGDQSVTTTVQINTKEENSLTVGFSQYGRKNLTENDKQQAMVAFKNDINKGKETYNQNRDAIKNINGDPFRLMEHLGWEVGDMESSEMEDWSDIGLEQDSEETTQIKVYSERGFKTHQVSVLKNTGEEEEREKGLALSPEEEDALFNEEFNLFTEKANAVMKKNKKTPAVINGVIQGSRINKNKLGTGNVYKVDTVQGKPVTDSYEFKDSPVHGLGSFATKDIKAGEEISLYYLNLLEDVPSYQRTDFCRWTNHSHINENISLIENNGNFTAHALKEIKEGEELFIDYFYVLETILSKIGDGGQVIDEVIRWTDGYDHIEIEEDNGDWKTLLNYFIEQGDCPNFIHESQFYEEVILALPDYPNQREIYDKDLFDSKLGRDDWELGDPTKPLGLHKIKEDEDPVKRAKRLKKYNATPEQRKRRSARTNERNKRIRKGQLAVGDGKDIDHKDGNPENNSASNISITSVKYNRGRNNNKGRTDEEHGAGDEGTKKLLKRYLKDTPYMTINDKFSKEL